MNTPIATPITAEVTPRSRQQRDTDAVRWHFSPAAWGALAFALLVAFTPYYRVIAGIFDIWNLQPEYSHGIIIPLISLFLIWRQRDFLARSPFTGSWIGVLIVVGGVLLWYLAELSTIYVFAQYAFLVELSGLVLALVGAATFRRLLMPLVILVFMIPLPAFFSNSLSLQLQLLSSALGVDVIRAFGIPVYLEGNVIDLGTFQLQVVEACSGLRYLLPLMTLAFLVAYLFQAPLWKRTLLFVASIPITVLMNSLRIGLIGVTVEYWGQEMAEGVLHSFEGWVVFMICTAALLGIAALLIRIGNRGARLRDALLLDWGPSPPKLVSRRSMPLPAPFFYATAVATAAAVAGLMLPERVEVHPGRPEFADFPVHLGAWQGQFKALGPEYDIVKLDDYLLADYHAASGMPVNVWIPYYISQRKGQSAHSPKACLPGSGWEYLSLEKRTLNLPGSALTVNRGLVKNGEHRELMYYWFQQRGRIITNEYLVKWYILIDAITRNRTDGAMIRLMTPLPPNASEAESDRNLTEIAAALSKELPRFVPD